MAKTALQRNTLLYEKIIKEAENSPHEKNYNAVCAKLKKLVAISNRLKSEKVKINPEQYKQLTESYEKVKNACDEYFAGKDSFSEFEQMRAVIFQDISKVLEKDINVLKSFNPQNPISLSEVLEKSRTHKIVLDSSKLQTVGGALSTRRPIRTNDGRKGFFTPITIYNQDEKWAEKLKDYEEIFGSISDECKDKLNLLKSDEKLQIEVSRHIWKKTVTKEQKNLPEMKERVTKLACELGMGKSADEVQALFNEKPEHYDSMVDFMNSVISIATKQRVMAVSGIKKGDNISIRNCAMTDVAQMLGCPHLLANSTEMTVEIDGQEIKGVFMETAKGTDTHRLKENDLIFKAKESSFNSISSVQQILDLQVLDYICGNTDRHSANLCYQFQKNKSGDVRFVGVQGIDNDCAFGRLNPQNGQSVMKMVTPEKMQYMTKSMAMTLKGLKREALEMKLAQYNFSKEEMEALWDRVKTLKNAVMNKNKEKNKIIIVDKEYLLNVPIQRKNYLKYVQNMAMNCVLGEKYKVNEEGDIKYTQEVHSANRIMYENLEEILKLREEMNNARAMIYNTSEYKLMAKHFETIEKITNEIKDKNLDLDNISDEMTDKLFNAYVGLAETTTNYMLIKSVVPSTTRGEKRLAFAKNLQKFADNTLEKLGVTFRKEEETIQEEKMHVKETEEMELGIDM